MQNRAQLYSNAAGFLCACDELEEPSNLRTKSVREWLDVFTKFDTDGSGVIGVNVLADVLKELFNVYLTSAHRDKLLARVDASADGALQVGARLVNRVLSGLCV